MIIIKYDQADMMSNEGIALCWLFENFLITCDRQPVALTDAL